MSYSYDTKCDALPREILLFPNPLLAKPSEPVSEITDGIKKLAGEMIVTMQAVPGMGLAAPQVGELKRIIVVDLGKEGEQYGFGAPFALVNPSIVESWGNVVDEEGCLSAPGIFAMTPRPERVVVQYTTLDGERLEIEAEAMSARAFAHEIDHLDGIMFWDRLGKARRLSLKIKHMCRVGLAVWKNR